MIERIPAHRSIPVAVAIALLAATGCDSGSAASSERVTVTVSPSAPRVAPQASVELQAAVSGSANAAVTWAVTGGTPNGTVTTTGVYTAPSSTGVFQVVATSQADPRASGIATVTVAGTPGAVARPAYNTGVGFFTVGGKLYDANGIEFHPKGFDTLHYALDYPGLPNSRANVVRMNTDLNESPATLRGYMDFAVGNGIVPIPYVSAPPASPNGAHTTCNTDTAVLTSAVDAWISQYAVYKPYERYMLLNIANEWGTDYQDNATAWRDAYITAIRSLRDAGFLCTLVIDSGGCGQDPNDLIHLAAAVNDADPQHNILFSWHVYAGYNVPLTDATIAGLMAQVAAASASDFPVIIGEFGPGPPYDTELYSDIRPLTVMQTASSLDMGWIYWAWDNVGTGWEVSVNGGNFYVTGGVPANGTYPNNTDLSAPGNIVVLHPTDGTFNAAVKAAIFP